MGLQDELIERSGGSCELCSSTLGCEAFLVEPIQQRGGEDYAWVCDVCKKQLEGSEEIDANHWRCLNDSMWSIVPAVQVLAFRMLNQLTAEGWPNDLLDQMYVDDEVLKWAKSGMPDPDAKPHVDSNGVVLSGGDTVVLVKDLEVKGAGFTAKRGTAVRNISLVADHPEQIEGKVNGQQIVILTQYVKKS